jgi:hypothetical protein
MHLVHNSRMTRRITKRPEVLDDVTLSELLAMPHEELAAWALKCLETERALSRLEKVTAGSRIPWTDALPQYGAKKIPPFR